MEPFRYHVYACDQRKPEGAPSCTANGSLAVIEALRREVAAQGLAGSVQITTCGSLGLCTRGPNLVVYPEGVWYSGLKPSDVMAVARGFVESRVLLSALELDLFTAVRAGASAEEAAAARATDPGATARLLNALAAMGLLAKKDGRFSPSPAAARFLARGGKDDSVDALLHQSSLWRTWSGLTEAVRTGRPAPREDMADRGDDWTVAFIAAMH
ncbi:MAG: methyltransferase dimerization domain-containing protein [Vicinamibacteria bacterium]